MPFGLSENIPQAQKETKFFLFTISNMKCDACMHVSNSLFSAYNTQNRGQRILFQGGSICFECIKMCMVVFFHLEHHKHLSAPLASGRQPARSCS